ncbi:MAG: hypothetical protein H6625_04815 [Bdellovibrionaceae bacterium]|nr:hypothetical protein [Pseudobdellovibrionaceae bacterium]
MDTVQINIEVLDHFLSHEICADKELFFVLVGELKKLLSGLEKLGVTGKDENFLQLAAFAHKLKVCSASFGAQNLRSLIEKLEVDAKSKDLVQVKTGFSNIMQIKEPTLVALIRHANNFFQKWGEESA